jgi:hypothetical protein
VHLFHVTYWNRLASIARHGLKPNSRRSIGAASYDGHAAGKVFFTVGDGVPFWHGRAEAFAEHHSDNPMTDELVPVVLRLKQEGVPDVEPDEPGTRDSGYYPAWMLRRTVKPEQLEFYAGDSGWFPMIDWEPDLMDPIESAFNIETEDEVDDDGEPVQFATFKNESPFNPYPDMLDYAG